MINHSIILFILFLCTINAPTNNILWPQPSSYTSDPTSPLLFTSPCSYNYTIQSTPVSLYPKQLLDFYLTTVFKCPKTIKTSGITVLIVIRNSNIMISNSKQHEKYQISLSSNYKWEINCDTYVGFTRGLQTFSQLFQPNTNPQPERMYTVEGIPIKIIDSPQFYWRGIMIDSSRHFLSIDTIKHTIDGMLYNKMNVLHWHIIDEDSFPMEVPSRPELSSYGKFDNTYSPSDITGIINYAKLRGIRVVPQIDTPGHVESWGRSPALSSIILNCNKKYEGQFDPTLNLTYQVVSDVMKYVKDQFTDDIVHFGGDQVVLACYDLRPSIKVWMTEHKIATYKDLEIYYRKEQKRIFRAMSNKTVMYWANEDIDLPVDQDDIIHWWGVSKNVERIVGRNNKVVLSNYDKTYMDVGFGNWPGNSYGTYITWRQAYTFQPRVAKVNVIGGQSCMWSELNTGSTQDKKLWIRSSAIAQRLWSVDIDFQTNMANIAKRLVSQASRMKSRGFKVSAVSVGLCEKDPQICFNGLHQK